MAKLKKQVLGKISGALGDIVFREVNGKNVVGMKPSVVNTPNDPESIARRAKFTLSAKLSQAINSNEMLKNIWALKAPSGLSTHNYVIKSNYLNVLPANLSDLIKLVPDAGFPVSYSAHTITSAGVDVTLNPIGQNNLIDTVIESKIQMLAITFLKDAVDTSVTEYTFIVSSSEIQALSLADPLTFNAPFIGNDELIFNKYQSNKTYALFVTLDNADKVIGHSNTLLV